MNFLITTKFGPNIGEMEEEFNLPTALASYICGQKRTAKSKQFVFLHGDYAIKGPYQQKRLFNVIARSQIFTAWNTPCVVKAVDYFTVKDGTFVRFPNIMTGYALESESYLETFSGLQYNVLKNPPVTDIGHAIPTNPWIVAEAHDVLLALCHCNILGIGDMNVRNTMVDPVKHQFFVIDFDDNLGSDRDDEIFYFNKRPRKDLMWYESVAGRYDAVAHKLVPLLSDEIVLANNLAPRVQRAIDLLRRYGHTASTALTIADTGAVQRKVTSLLIQSPIKIQETIQGNIRETRVVSVRVEDIRPRYQDLQQWCEDPNNVYIGRGGIVFVTGVDGKQVRYPPASLWANPFKIGEDIIGRYREYILNRMRNGEITAADLENLRGKTLGCWCKIGGQDIPCHGDVLLELLGVRNPIPANQVVNPVVNPVVNSIITPIVEPVINSSGRKLGQMVWKGLRGGATKTYSGIDLDVAKSAVQKYIRRNMSEKAIMAAIELYRLGEVGGQPGVTNMYNRLAIIANEDIGPANLALVLEVTRLVESGDRDIYRLVAMIQLMAESPKTRMMSHAWRAYANPEGRAVALKLGLLLDTTFTEADMTYIAENNNSDLFLASDPENIRPCILIFLKRLQECDFNAYSWAYFYLEMVADLKLAKRKKFINGNTRCTTGKADILLWKALAKVLAPEIHDVLVEAYFNHTESRPFLQNAILVALYNVPYQKFDMEPAIAIWRQQPVLEQILNGDFVLEIDGFVIDKHTQKGRAAGATVQDFVDEGAIVIPQDEKFFNSVLADIYKIR